MNIDQKKANFIQLSDWLGRIQLEIRGRKDGKVAKEKLSLVML